jgi:hypothetical protein
MLAYYLAITLTACAGMVSQSPATPEQSIAAAQLQLNGILRTHANLIDTGRVTPAIDASLVDQEGKASQLIAAAKLAVKAGDIAKSKTELEAMQVLLIELNKRIAQLEAAK